jgi:hypothetical protein
MLDCSFGDIAGPVEGKLLDHRPLKLNKDDFERVRRIPYKKVGGSFFQFLCDYSFPFDHNFELYVLGGQLPCLGRCKSRAE